MVTTIQIEEKSKQRLDKFKVHHRESYNELINRLLDNYSPKMATRESLIETINVLSNPKLMKQIKEALEDTKGISLEDLEEELGINV